MKSFTITGSKMTVKVEQVESKNHRFGDWKLTYTMNRCGTIFHEATMDGITFNEERIEKYATNAAN